MGAWVAKTLTDTHRLRKGVATRFYEMVDQGDMETNKAYNTVLDFLECELRGGFAHLYSYITWIEIEEYQRGPGESIDEYISEMEAKWRRAGVARAGKIHPDVKAMMMLNRSGCTERERREIIGFTINLKSSLE